MAVFSFIEEYNLADKTIVPFCAHGTGGIAGSVRDITAALPDSAEVLEPLGVYRADIGQAQSEVNEWLAEIGFQEKAEENAELENSEKNAKMTIDGQEIFITLYRMVTIPMLAISVFMHRGEIFRFFIRIFNIQMV